MTRGRSRLAERRRDARQRRTLRALRWTGGTALVLALALTVLALPLTLFPDTLPAPSDESDAVVLLSGGRGERLDRALAVMARTEAPALWISNGSDPRWPEANALCGTRGESYAVRCFEPVPQSTRGEARWVAESAGDEGWTRVTLVTSTYHVTRARQLTQRCFGGAVEAVAATPDHDWTRAVALTLRELAGLARDTFVDRDC
ncbi:MAG: YdcF family protein [Euzebyales bacterium]|nr:YdcF family protein [Euzebyales bacterium]